MGTLTAALQKVLPAGSVRLHATAQTLTRVGGRWDVTLDTGETLSYDGVLLALPAHKAAKLLRPLESGAADILAGVAYASSVNLYIAYPWSSLTRAPESFGFVSPRALKKSFLGCTFASAKFPFRSAKDVALLRVFVAADRLSDDDETITAAILSELKPILGIRGEPLFTSVTRHSQALPQYTVGHAERVGAIEWRLKTLPRFALAGNGLQGIGIPDCVRVAESAAEMLIDKMAYS
jgi:oxygen-dependent protoporphyrinogen oxidase